jgi:hypothetical protein
MAPLATATATATPAAPRKPTPEPRCILDDLGRGHCTHDCGGPLDCPLPDTGTSSATCLFDVCFVYCGAEGDLECPDGMVCGMSTWVGNPLSNVCIWP